MCFRKAASIRRCFRRSFSAWDCSSGRNISSFFRRCRCSSDCDMGGDKDGDRAKGFRANVLTRPPLYPDDLSRTCDSAHGFDYQLAYEGGTAYHADDHGSRRNRRLGRIMMRLFASRTTDCQGTYDRRGIPARNGVPQNGRRT